MHMQTNLNLVELYPVQGLFTPSGPHTWRLVLLLCHESCNPISYRGDTASPTQYRNSERYTAIRRPRSSWWHWIFTHSVAIWCLFLRRISKY